MNEILDNLNIRVSSPRYGVVLAVTLLCGATDLWRFRVYNMLTIPLLLSGFGYHLLASSGEHLGFPVVGAVLAAALLLPFCALGGVGTGDLKLLAGIGAWIGAYDVLVVFVVTGLLVGVYSLSVTAFTADSRKVPNEPPRGPGGSPWTRRFWRHRADVDEVAEQDSQTRRRRLVPMAAMMATALVILGVVQTLREAT